MRVEDLILVSVDDHVVEPPDLFEGRLSARAAERAPAIEKLENGREVWMFEGAALPNVGLNAVAGPGPGGVRRRPARLLARCAPAATTSTSASGT